jgi:predicted amidophosphoribosyltransferase
MKKHIKSNVFWVCRKGCWNKNKGLCKECAPDLGVEMAAAQASKSVEEVWAHAAMAEEDKKLGTEVWREGIQASCPNCEAPLASNAKILPRMWNPAESQGPLPILWQQGQPRQ